MTNLFLTDENIKKAIMNLGISQEQKNALIAKIPELNGEEREKLMNLLKDVYLLDMEEKDAIEKIKRNWTND